MSEGGVRGCGRSCRGTRGANPGLEQSSAAPGTRPLCKLECSNCSIFKKPRGTGASAWLCKASAAAPSSFPFPMWLCRSRLLKVPVPSGWFGDRALAGPSLGTAAAFPSSALQNPAHFFPLIAPGSLWGWVSSCPIPECPQRGAGHQLPSLAAPAAKPRQRSCNEPKQLKAPAADGRCSLSLRHRRLLALPFPHPFSRLLLILFLLIYFPPRTSQPFPKQDPRLPLHP